MTNTGFISRCMFRGAARGGRGTYRPVERVHSAREGVAGKLAPATVLTNNVPGRLSSCQYRPLAVANRTSSGSRWLRIQRQNVRMHTTADNIVAVTRAARSAMDKRRRILGPFYSEVV